jgi:hypothetical protein
MQVSDYEENRKFGFQSDKPFSMHILFDLEPVPAGTNLHLFADGEPDGFFGKLAMPIVTRFLERQMASDLYSLKAILEVEA